MTARVQTRKTISMAGDLFALAKQQADAEGKTLSNRLAELVREWLAGAGLTLPEQGFQSLERAQKARHAKRRPQLIAEAAERVRRDVERRRAPSAIALAGDTGFCANNPDHAGPFVLRAVGPNDALVKICHGCDEEHPRSGRYAFDGGRQIGLTQPRSDGNKQTPARRIANR